MPVSYIDPAERAWTRTRRLLFRPFDVEKWAIIGFAAFLAGLAGRWAGIGLTPRWNFRFPPDFDDLFEPPFGHLFDRFGDSSWFLGLPLGLGMLVVGVALAWLGSRGKLIFLDNVVRERAAFVEPWKEYGKLGDSLFVWRIGFYAVGLLAAAIVLMPMFLLGRGIGGTGIGRPLGTLVSFGAAAGSFLFGLIFAYVALFLDAFVVPLMYRRKITAVEAWRAFLPLLRANFAEFVAFGLVVLLAFVAAFLGIVAAVVATCCSLSLLLAVPYLNSILLLPLTTLYRLYTIEFLEQYGPEFAILQAESAPEDEASTPDP